MKYTKIYSPNAGVKVVAGLLVASQITAIAEEANAQTVSTEVVETLEPTTVIASKFEKALKDVSASVAVLDVVDLQAEGKLSVQDGIGYRVPGVIATSTAGQRGKPSSIFVRGTTSKYTQVRVDGVSLADSNGSGIHNFLGSSNLFGFSDIEILKGASSSIYGAGAVGGVISLTTARGEGDPTSSVTAEYGSYNSWLGNLSSKGQVGDFSYNLGVTAEDTQNDSDATVDGSDFTQLSYYSRFDYVIDTRSSVGMTLRGGDSEYESPTQVASATQTAQQNEYSYLFATAFYENQISDAWRTRLILGLNKEDYDSDGSVYGPTSEFDTNVSRYSIYWDNEYVWSEDHTTVGGVYFVNSKYKNNFSAGDAERNTYGLYANHAWQVTEDFQLNGGLGWDEHDDYAPETTWSAGGIYNVTDSTVLKVNAGTAFLAPSFSRAEFSSDLEGEQSFSWDMGVEQTVGSAVISATWFETDIDNYIEYDGTDSSGNSTYKNVPGKTKTSGLEFSVESPIDQINSTVYVSYTYLADALATEIPQQVASVGFDTQVNEKLSTNITASWVDETSSTESAYTSKNDLTSYFLVNLSVNYQIRENVRLHARIENLLDDDYRLGNFTGPIFGEEFSSVKGRGRGFYGGVTVTF